MAGLAQERSYANHSLDVSLEDFSLFPPHIGLEVNFYVVKSIWGARGNEFRKPYKPGSLQIVDKGRTTAVPRPALSENFLDLLRCGYDHGLVSHLILGFPVSDGTYLQMLSKFHRNT